MTTPTTGAKPRGLQHGMTMIEIVVGIALLTIIAAWAVSNLQPIIRNFAVKSNAETVLNGLHLARAEAIKRNTSVNFVLTPSPLAWNVSCTTVVASVCPSAMHTYTAPSSSVTVTATGGNTATFNSLGRLAAGTTQLNITATGARSLRILVKANGQAKLCDPDTNIPSTDPRYCI